MLVKHQYHHHRSSQVWARDSKRDACQHTGTR